MLSGKPSFPSFRRAVVILALAAIGATFSGCAVFSATGLPAGEQPSNHRNWRPDLAVASHAEFSGDEVLVHNIRNSSYRTAEDYTVAHYDKTFDLNSLESLDFIVVPFKDTPSLAHTMLSFGFGQGQYLAVSVEARMEQGEEYSPYQGALNRYELMYVLGDEKDLIQLRTKHRGVDVYVYKGLATRRQIRALFVDVMNRTNRLHDHPEFYDTFVNNCTTNVVNHINHISPSRIPYTYHTLLPGYADRLAYNLGLLDTEYSFEETKRRARINQLAERFQDSPDFSERIRSSAVWR